MKIGHCFFCHAQSKENCCEDCYLELFQQQTPRCPVCAKISDKNRICGGCLVSPPAFDSGIVAFDFRYPLDRFIHKIKFGHRPDYLPMLCQSLIKTLLSREMDFPQVITAVPLSKQRQQNRGFNQSALIARTISKSTNIPYMNMFKRIKDGPPQSTLSQKLRKTNVRGVFSLSTNKIFQHVAIIDDIITTGSTVNELAKLLKKNGCENIEIWALAKTPGH